MSDRTICSDAILKAVQLAIEDGNEIAEISEGWAKVRQVVHMKKPMTSAVREKLSHTQLRHWTTEPTPHNNAEEGFSDDAEKVAVTFPK
jgi:hypothetical protein